MNRRSFLAGLTAGVAPTVASSRIHASTPQSHERLAAAGNSISQALTSITPGSWAEVRSGNIDETMGVGNVGDMLVRNPYSGASPWNPITKRIVFVGCDHGAQYEEPGECARVDYDDATNRWTKLYPSIGTHQYQHVAVNWFAGDVYMRHGADILRDDGVVGQREVTLRDGVTKKTVPCNNWTKVWRPATNIGQIAAVALAWWHGPFPGGGKQGVLLCYDGNANGSIGWWNPLNSASGVITNCLPGQIAYYHVVSAYLPQHNCLLYGGGNTYTAAANVDKQIWRLNADLTKTRMPDAPFRVGIYGGMQLVPDLRSREAMFVGFGQAWSLSPVGHGTWKQLPPPPAEMLDPAAAESVSSCGTEFGPVFIDAKRSRTPKCRMWVYKTA